MRRVAAAIVWLVLLGAAAPAWAQASQPTAAESTAPAAAPAPKPQPWKLWLEREKPPDEPVVSTRTWYGWQTLLIDGLALTAMVLTQGDEGILIGAGLLLISTPIVHFVHQNVQEGMISLGLRGLAAAAAFGAVALSSNEVFDNEGDTSSWSALLGVFGVLALVSAIVIDAAVFSWEGDDQARDRAVLAPLLDPAHGRAGLSYATRF